MLIEEAPDIQADVARLLAAVGDLEIRQLEMKPESFAIDALDTLVLCRQRAGRWGESGHDSRM